MERYSDGCTQCVCDMTLCIHQTQEEERGVCLILISMMLHTHTRTHIDMHMLYGRSCCLICSFSLYFILFFSVSLYLSFSFSLSLSLSLSHTLALSLSLSLTHTLSRSRSLCNGKSLSNTGGRKMGAPDSYFYIKR